MSPRGLSCQKGVEEALMRRGPVAVILSLAAVLFFALLPVSLRAEGLPSSFAELVEELKPVVVNISTTKLVRSPLEDFFKDLRRFREFFGDEFFHRFFQGPPEMRTRSLGSGFIVDKEGYILTNNHVIEGAEDIKVKLYNGKVYDAKVVGRDPKTDIALIKIEAKEDLPVARLGDSDRLRVGDWVIAIGNPFGLEHTVTAGIISAKGRVIGAGPYDDFLQTDASINPGNSGGPLFNLKGEVVGINTAIVAGGQGVGFAIPINMAKNLLPQLKKGKVVHGFLGVYIQDLTPELARSFGLKEAKGALVTEVIPDSPAQEAGFQKGDVIIRYDGKEVRDTHALRRMVASTPGGRRVKVDVIRKGKEVSLSVEIGKLEEREEMAQVEEDQWGLRVQDVTPELASHLGLPDDKGVVVSEVVPGSPAHHGGISPGDVIIGIEHEEVGDLSDYRKLMKRYRAKESLLLTVRIKAQRYHTLFVVLQKEGR